MQQRETSLLDPGEQKLIQSGVNGKKTVTYEQRIVNGELRSQKAVEETVTQQPVPEIVLVGVAGKAVSRWILTWSWMSRASPPSTPSC